MACPYCLSDVRARPLWTEPAVPNASDRFPVELATRTVTVAECPACDGLHVVRDFPESLLDTFYGVPPGIPVTHEHARWWGRSTDRSNRHLLDALGAARDRRLLDYGCGRGLLGLEARDRGWAVTAVDCNPSFTQFIGDAYRLQTITGTIADVEDTFDAIVLADVLEHMYAPRYLLAECARRLAPGGRIAIKVPHGCMQWRKERLLRGLGRSPGYIATLGHLNQFDPPTLQLVLEGAGFTNVRITTAPLFLPNRQPHRTIAAAANLVFRYAPASMGLHLLAIAERVPSVS